MTDRATTFAEIVAARRSLRAYLPDAIIPYREAIALTVVIAILLVRPKGLLGRTEAVR